MSSAGRGSSFLWGALLVALIALAGFILFLTVTGEPIPVRGFGIALALLLVAAYPAQKLRGDRSAS